MYHPSCLYYMQQCLRLIELEYCWSIYKLQSYSLPITKGFSVGIKGSIMNPSDIGKPVIVEIFRWINGCTIFYGYDVESYLSKKSLETVLLSSC